MKTDNILRAKARIVARAGFDEFIRLNGDMDDGDLVMAAKVACADALLAIPKTGDDGAFLFTNDQLADIARKAVRRSLSYRMN